MSRCRACDTAQRIDDRGQRSGGFDSCDDVDAATKFLVMAEAAKERDSRACLEDHVDLGRRQFEGWRSICVTLGQSLDGDVVRQRAGFNQANAFG